MTNVAELLAGHVSLEVECADRVYLNGYIPTLATSGGLVTFLRQQRKLPIPSPAALGKITGEWVDAVKLFAEDNEIPIVRFQHGQRKDDLANQIRRETGIRNGIVFIGVAQEKAKTFSGHKVEGPGPLYFEYTRDKTVYVNHYYFYVDDEEFGPAFVKMCSYAPWAMKVCLNGHEWAKRQLEKGKVPFEALDNGFLSCEKPDRLKKVCESLGPDDIDAFFRRWLGRLPLPLSEADRQAGYDWQLSIWQLEVSLTQVFDRPLRGREFFEEVIRDNLDLGRPDRIQLVFERRISKATPSHFRSRVIQNGVSPSLHVEYKSFDLKQYFKEGRALRTESTFNDPHDFDVNKGLSNFPYLYELGRHINRRLLDVERVSQNCGLSADGIQRVVQPTVTEDGQKASGLRFGDPRVMALFLALNLFLHLVNGVRNRELRPIVAQLLGKDLDSYTAGQMTYDLRRLCRKGILFRQSGANRYFLTPYGWKIARLFCRLEARVFRPALTAFDPSSPALPYPKLSAALREVDRQFELLISERFPTMKAA